MFATMLSKQKVSKHSNVVHDLGSAIVAGHHPLRMSWRHQFSPSETSQMHQRPRMACTPFTWRIVNICGKLGMGHCMPACPSWNTKPISFKVISSQNRLFQRYRHINRVTDLCTFKTCRGVRACCRRLHALHSKNSPQVSHRKRSSTCETEDTEALVVGI